MNIDDKSDRTAIEYSLKYNPPMDPILGELNLKEAKQILDKLGVKFLLGSGSCLGATRDQAFIPWDDDIDLFSVADINDTTEESIDIMVSTFRNNGYFVDLVDSAHSKILITLKESVRLSVECSRITDGSIYVYPGIRFPAKMFTHPKEISFLGENFLVPNPPEEYLRIKYGEQWMTPKKAGEYEKDVVEKIPVIQIDGRPCRLRILDSNGDPISDAEVVLVSGGRSRSNDQGYAEIILPRPDWFSLIIRYPGHEQVLYMEEMEPDKTYVYRSDAASRINESGLGNIGTLGNLLTLE